MYLLDLNTLENTFKAAVCEIIHLMLTKTNRCRHLNKERNTHTHSGVIFHSRCQSAAQIASTNISARYIFQK